MLCRTGLHDRWCSRGCCCWWWSILASINFVRSCSRDRPCMSTLCTNSSSSLFEIFIFTSLVDEDDDNEFENSLFSLGSSLCFSVLTSSSWSWLWSSITLLLPPIPSLCFDAEEYSQSSPAHTMFDDSRLIQFPISDLKFTWIILAFFLWRRRDFESKQSVYIYSNKRWWLASFQEGYMWYLNIGIYKNIIRVCNVGFGLTWKYFRVWLVDQKY